MNEDEDGFAHHEFTVEQMVGNYLAYTRQLPLLSPDEESTIRERVGSGAAVRRDLIESYLELAALIALKLAPPGVHPMRAVEEANFALVDLLSSESDVEPVLVLAHRVKERLDALDPRQ